MASRETSSGAPVGTPGGSSVGDVVGGFRLVRRLGAGVLAEVHLAVPLAGGDPVAIKLARPQVGHESVLAEAHALWRARGEHSVALRDMADRGDLAHALVLDLVPTPLHALLRSPGGVPAPAAATVLLPIAAALRRMHRCGVAHGRIGPAAIRLDERGAPVLVGFGGATLFAADSSDAELAGTAGVIEDARAFRALAVELLDPEGATGALRPGAHRTARGIPMSELGGDAVIAADPHGWLERFEALVYEHITPGAVALPEFGNDAAELVPRSEGMPVGRGVLLAVDRSADIGTRRGARDAISRRRPVRRRASAIAGALDDLGGRAQSWVADRMPDGWSSVAATAVLRAVGARLLSRVGPVRARAWVPAAVVLVGLVAAIVVVPTGGGEATPADPAGAVDASPGAEATSEAPATSSSAAPQGPVPTLDATAPPVADPEVAALDLLQRRADCFADRDAGCVLEVVQAGSPAESADLAAIAALDGASAESVEGAHGGGTVDDGAPADGARWEPVEAVLIDLLGGAALVDVVVRTPAGSGTVPVLLVLSDARWRIRAILAAPAITGSGEP
jgi:hypothetical protein